MNKLTIRDIELLGKRILIRVDFNVPLDAKGQVLDDFRIRRTIPTIRYALNHGARYVVLLSHFSRPEGRRVASMSLQPLVPLLEDMLGLPVLFLDDCMGPETLATIHHSATGSVFLSENLRFYIEEEGKGIDDNGRPVKAHPGSVAQFRAKVASFGDVFINDAFGTSHRMHSSVVGLNCPQRVAGLLVREELEAFSHVLDTPVRPFVCIIGGKKLRGKIPLLEALIDKVDALVIGGGMSYTFLKVAYNMQIGLSLYDTEGADYVVSILEKAKRKGVTIVLPKDFVVTETFSEYAKGTIYTMEQGIPSHLQSLDIGPASVAQIERVLKDAKTVFMNGPMGVYEYPAFANGTKRTLEALATVTKKGCFSIVGGGDSASACKKFGLEHSFSHMSTGGGASMRLLQGKPLPGVEALTDVKQHSRL